MTYSTLLNLCNSKKYQNIRSKDDGILWINVTECKLILEQGNKSGEHTAAKFNVNLTVIPKYVLGKMCLQ